MPDQSLPDSDSDSFSGLERELAAALRELEEYQRLIDELPQIYEDKFGAQVLALAQEIALLTDERHRLQLLIQDCIQADAVLPPARSSTGDSLPLGWHGPQRWLGRLAPRSLTLLAAGSLSVILAVGLAWQASKRRPVPGSPTVSRETVPARPQAPLAVPRPAAPPQTAERPPLQAPAEPAAEPAAESSITPATPGTSLEPAPSAPSVAVPSPGPQPQAASAPPASPAPAPGTLRVRARDEVWFEIRSQDDELVYTNTFEPGQERSFALGKGMRIRSGRPHLLDVAVGSQPFAPLGVLNDHDWHTIQAP